MASWKVPARSFASENERDVEKAMEAAKKRKAEVDASLAKKAAANAGRLQISGVSGKYAGALLQAAIGSKADLRAVGADLVTFNEVLKNDERVKLMMVDPLSPGAKKAENIRGLCKAIGLKDKLTAEVIVMLHTDNVLSKLSDICRDYEVLMLDHLKEVRGTVISAEPLSKAQLKQVEDKMKGLLEKGESLVLSTQVDPSILGGLIIKMGDKRQDLSVRYAISHLTQGVRQLL